MISILQLTGEALGRLLADDFRRLFGTAVPRYPDVLESVAQVAVECLGNSDALYHNVEHTLNVTLVARDILRGRSLTHHTTPADFLHTLVAAMAHDIGYVRGVLRGDRPGAYVIDEGGGTITLPRGASDAALGPYHVDRSKRFVRERLAEAEILDPERLAAAIEATRFPMAGGPLPGERCDDEPSLVRAADLIGQLADPLYLRKANALFAEFQELGYDRQLGYTSPADLVDRYPDFFWRQVSPVVQEAIGFLNVTVTGRQWIANLHSNIFCAEHAYRLNGPQR